MKKQVANVVFYKYFDGKEVIQKACIFYNDGTVAEEREVAEGLKALEEVTARLNITSTDLFKSMINKEIVYAMSGAELKERFASFIVNDAEKVADEDIIIENDEAKRIALEEAAKAEAKRIAAEEAAKAEAKRIAEEEAAKAEAERIAEEEAAKAEAERIAEEETAKEEAATDGISDETAKKIAAMMAAKEAAKAATSSEPETIDEETEDKDAEDDEVISDGVEPKEEEIEDKELLVEEEKTKKDGFFKRIGKKLKDKLKVIGLVATTAVIGLFGLTGCEAKLKTKEGTMAASNIASADFVGPTRDKASLFTGNNNDYSEYTTDELLTVTNDKAQKSAMSSVRDTLKNFNEDFANYYIEAGKEVNGKSIKPALTFDEVVALQQAYNDYSKEEVRAIFNGSEVNAEKMTRAYKDASLQLMGAYVIENPEHPVDMSMLIDSQEGKDFYKKYHDMFLAAKAETTYEGKAAKMTEFYKAVREDFPITQEVRTEGIAHADDYKTITSYKLAVTPMIAAAEMMYQNLETDVTLNDSEIDFLNDIGLCNYADDKFERLETITLSSTEDKTNPTFEQFKESLVTIYENEISDERRDLSQLDSFQDAVNWHFLIVGEGSYDEETHSYTTYSTYTKSSTSYRTEETRTNKPITDAAKKEIDDKIAAENEAAKKQAEEEAAKKGQELQAEADKEKGKIDKEVAEEAADLQEKIDTANEQIKKNNDDDPTNDKPIYESDLGHGTHFDEDHSDGNGKLNDSVEDITTDGQGAVKHDDPLPDPNATGAQFDAQAGTFYGENGYKFTGHVYEYNVPAAATPSYEEVVDTYVENLAGNEYEGGYQYTYSN